MGVLSEAWAAGERRSCKRWGDVQRPVDAARLSLERLGWSWTSACEFRVCSGEIYNAGSMSPIIIRHGLLAAVKAVLEKQVAQSLSLKGWTLEAAGCNRISMETVVEASRDKSLTAREAGAVGAVAVDATWPASRMAAAGYDVDPNCAMCDSGLPDTLFHRAWVCCCSEHLRALLPDGLVRRAIAAGPSSALYLLGITPHVDELMPLAALDSSEVVVNTTDGGQPLFKEGAVYVDGSCLAQWGRQHTQAA